MAAPEGETEELPLDLIRNRKVQAYVQAYRGLGKPPFPVGLGEL